MDVISLGLTAAQQRAYHAALAGSREMAIRVRILDRDERPFADLMAPAPRVLEGSVSVDVTADVTRSLQLVVLDPDRKLHLDSDSPSRTALHPGQFIAVERRDYIDALGRYVSAPVFWGPLVRFERKGHTVAVEAQGKESLGLDPALLWKARAWRKGVAATAVIKAVLAEAGEKRFNVPDLASRIPTDVSIGRHDEAWRVAKTLARALNRQLFYDGAGRATLRPHPAKPTWTFHAISRDGSTPMVLSEPAVAYDFAVRNTIEVLGPEPAGAKARVRAVATPPRAHPLSPWSLARNGAPRHLVETIENDKIKRTADAAELAARVLEDRLRIGLQISFDTLPVPHLEESDLVALVTREDTYTFRVRAFTIPLTADGRMSIGALRRQQLARRRR